MMVGGAMSGYCSTGKVNNPMMPRMTIVMEMTAEKTGRSIKVLRFMILSVKNYHSFVVGLRRKVYLHAANPRLRPQLRPPLSSHSLRYIPDLHSHGSLARELIAPCRQLPYIHRPCPALRKWQLWGTTMQFSFRTGMMTLPEPPLCQQSLFIGEHGTQTDCTRRGIDYTTDSFYLTFLRIDRTVIEL